MKLDVESVIKDALEDVNGPVAQAQSNLAIHSSCFSACYSYLTRVLIGRFCVMLIKHPHLLKCCAWWQLVFEGGFLPVAERNAPPESHFTLGDLCCRDRFTCWAEQSR